MATIFVRTDTIRTNTNVEGKVYAVFIDLEFWGWVSGEKGVFVAMGTNDYSWGPARRTRAKSMEARDAQRAQAVPAPLADQPVPTDVKVVRLTVDNLAQEAASLVGWMIDGAQDLGAVAAMRVTYDGFGNAMVTGQRGRDVLGLPSTITAYRV